MQGAATAEFAGVLNHCDENKDGAISLAECQKSKGAKDPASVESWFRSRDDDRDGQLTANDFAPKSGKKS